MKEFLAAVPWGFMVTGYVGLLVYVLTSLADASDETLSSVADVFTTKGKTILTSALVVPVLILGAQHYGELNGLAAFACGYANLSIIRKVTDHWQAKAKLTGGN